MCQTPLGRTQTFLDAALVDSLKAHHEDGRSCASLAREHGLDKMTVIRTLREAGVETIRRPVRGSTELASRVRGLRENGLSERGIAAAVGVSRSSVHRLLAVKSGGLGMGEPGDVVRMRVDMTPQQLRVDTAALDRVDQVGQNNKPCPRG